MAEIEIKNHKNQTVGSEALPDAIFNAKVSEALIWEDVRNYLAVGRAGTASTKTRAEVRGGGKKPWRQKGTGRARHGSIRSPLWRGGGITFGPKPRNYAYKIPKKKRWGALYASLTQKAKEGAVVILDSILLEAPKTKLLLTLLQNLDIKEKKVLIVENGDNKNLYLSSRNIPRVETIAPMAMRSYNVINADVLLITKSALQTLREGAPKWN